MIGKTKEVFKKLEFGLLELFIGALMLIGLMGYFGSVAADLDWIDHTISFILFSYLFYKLDITLILFGKTSRLANSMIVISYFSLFFKDIISYTALDAFKFKVIAFVNYFYQLYLNNILITNIASFYIGVIGILAASIYIAINIKVSRPSMLCALHKKNIKSKLIKFLSIFVLLLGFYYFVYNMLLEWLEFALDDPIIAIGIAFYMVKIAKHREKFHSSNFIFKIGDFSARLYKRFVSLFHYKKTMALAVSGLLMLHALSDLGIFAYSLVFLRENFYLGLLRHGHSPFLKLFLEDVKNVPAFAAAPLFASYALNAISLIVLLLIPVIAWGMMFLQKRLRIGRVLIFFIYSSVVAFMLLPGYIIQPISSLSVKGAVIGDDKSVYGVDIQSISLLESNSILKNLFPDKTSIVMAVPLISIFFGLIMYALSSNHNAKRELYALSIIGGLTFYGIYLFYFLSSAIAYFYEGILLTIFTPNFLVGIVLALLLALSIIFYIVGYLMFVYEIAMEYHKRKWSDIIGIGLVNVIRKVKGAEK
ncbi:hypothetical protein HYY71_03760 [Candidatus Woesearchaeota archaeon]|nr:hypothetical protein [Candidatus Woesearchaeota archaeon]